MGRGSVTEGIAMSDEQSRKQLLSCLESVKLDLEEIKQHSSAVMVGQAIDTIESQAKEIARLTALAITHPTDICECRFDFSDGDMEVRNQCDYHKRLTALNEALMECPVHEKDHHGCCLARRVEELQEGK
jgi:hypothetical protein